MIYTDEQKKGIIIYSGKVANELLRQGYRITRVIHIIFHIWSR